MTRRDYAIAYLPTLRPFEQPMRRPERYRELIRLARRVALPSRIIVVALEEERPWWDDAVRGIPHQNIVQMPFDRGTGISVLLGALEIRKRCSTARVRIVSIPSEGSAKVPRRFTLSSLLFEYRRRQPEALDLLSAHIRHNGRYAMKTLDQIAPFLPAIELDPDVLHWVEAQAFLVPKRVQPAAPSPAPVVPLFAKAI